MIFRTFKVNCVVRIVGIAINAGILAWLMVNTVLYATMTLALIVLILQTFSLIRYVDRSNRDLIRFLDAVKHTDFSTNFIDDGRAGSHRELRAMFDEVLTSFRNTRLEKEEHFRYLQNVMTHVNIGLLSFDATGRVDFINMAARRLLDIGQIKSIDQLAESDRPMAARLYAIEAGQKLLTKIERDGEMLQLSLSATQFRLGDRMIKLISLQNIAGELAQREMDAWQQLVQVLTHEIMNSVTPIASLASTARTILDAEDGNNEPSAPLTDNDIEDLRSAVTTIERRGQGLLRFVQSYRQLSRIPKPTFQIVSLNDLFARVTQLMSSRPDAKNIRFETNVEPTTLELTADPDLLEQVLLNLMINGVQAIGDRADGTIKLSANLVARGSVTISVTDNGSGIGAEALKSIFVPFFTTKPEGTGLGLSLSRQIVRLHGGQISATSEPNKETKFTLHF